MESREIVQREAEFRFLVREVFGFLVTEFGFSPAVEEDGEYRYCLNFRHPETRQSVMVLNAFHGNDYGFEVNITEPPEHIYYSKMLYYKLKEKQDSKFLFVFEGAKVLRTQLSQVPNIAFNPDGFAAG
jgi:hypothetical protein